MKTVTSKAEFIDGPLQGTIKEFDREEPPLTQFYGGGSGRSLTYIREENPFGDGEKWIYMLDWPRPKETP